LQIYKQILLPIIFFSGIVARSQTEIDFVSDTQAPMTVEKVKLHANHNTLATAMIFSEMLKNKPLAVYMLGDVVSVGSNNRKWRMVDNFIDSCHQNKIVVHALLGNHDVMWSRKKGEKNFAKRFPGFKDVGYVTVTDSIGVIMLNSNFKKLSSAEIDEQQKWYQSALKNLDSNNAVKAIIVSCHHAPFSNSLIVGSSKLVQKYFVPDFIQTKKCKLFITGHAHAFEHFTFSGKDFLVIGGGGGLHQPMDTSINKIRDLASLYKPMFHYLSLQRQGDILLLVSHFIKQDFSGFEKGYSFEIK
jgi:hypothetical protein